MCVLCVCLCYMMCVCVYVCIEVRGSRISEGALHLRSGQPLPSGGSGSTQYQPQSLSSGTEIPVFARRSGPFSAERAHLVRIRGDSGHRVGEQSSAAKSPRRSLPGNAHRDGPGSTGSGKGAPRNGRFASASSLASSSSSTSHLCRSSSAAASSTACSSGRSHQAAAPPDEAVILLHLPPPLVGVSMVMERERQQNDRLVNGYWAKGCFWWAAPVTGHVWSCAVGTQGAVCFTLSRSFLRRASCSRQTPGVSAMNRQAKCQAVALFAWRAHAHVLKPHSCPTPKQHSADLMLVLPLELRQQRRALERGLALGAQALQVHAGLAVGETVILMTPPLHPY